MRVSYQNNALFGELELDQEEPKIAPPIVGEAPVLVATGAPGAREEVRAYSERIRAAWREFYDTDYAPWFSDRTSGKAGAGKLAFNVPAPPGVPTFNDPIVMGSAVGGTPQERELMTRVEGDRAAFLAYAKAIEGFDLFGPSPSQAWQALILHENALKADRARFTPATGRALKSPDPDELEREGGIKQEGFFSGVNLGTIATVVGVVAGAVIFSSAVRAVRG